MDTEIILETLVDVAKTLGFTVRATKGNFRGGRCVVDGTPTIVLNTRHLPETRLRVLARALHGTPLETVYLKPAVRDALHAAWNEMDLPPPRGTDDAGSDDAGAGMKARTMNDASSLSTSTSVSAEDNHGHD